VNNLPRIDKEKLFTESPEGIVITSETSRWLEDVVDTINHLLKFGIKRSKQTQNELALLILAINHEQSGCTSHEKCKAKLEALL
jgi:hypothetical protein